MGSGRNKDTEDLPCLGTKMGGGVVKTRIKFIGTPLKKKKKSNYKIYPLSLLYQHKRHFKQSLALTILKKFLSVHIYKYINMHFYSSPGRRKTSLKPLGLIPFRSSCLYAANSRSLRAASAQSRSPRPPKSVPRVEMWKSALALMLFH